MLQEHIYIVYNNNNGNNNNNNNNNNSKNNNTVKWEKTEAGENHKSLTNSAYDLQGSQGKQIALGANSNAPAKHTNSRSTTYLITDNAYWSSSNIW